MIWCPWLQDLHLTTGLLEWKKQEWLWWSGFRSPWPWGAGSWTAGIPFDNVHTVQAAFAPPPDKEAALPAPKGGWVGTALDHPLLERSGCGRATPPPLCSPLRTLRLCLWQPKPDTWATSWVSSWDSPLSSWNHKVKEKNDLDELVSSRLEFPRWCRVQGGAFYSLSTAPMKTSLLLSHFPTLKSCGSIWKAAQLREGCETYPHPEGLILN